MSSFAVMQCFFLQKAEQTSIDALNQRLWQFYQHYDTECQGDVLMLSHHRLDNALIRLYYWSKRHCLAFCRDLYDSKVFST